MAVNKERIKLLIDALRSGKYQQCVSRLEQIDEKGNRSNCCLGVACRVAMEHGVKLDVVEKKILRSPPMYKTMFNGNPTDMPDAVCGWFGFATVAGGFTVEEIDQCGHDVEKFGSLISLNDNGATFEQIADIIEANMEKL